MTSSVKIHGALLAASLIAAYLVWTREPSSDSDDDEIAIVNLRQLDKVVYEEEERKVEITRKKDDKGEFFWVRVEKMVAKPRPPRVPSPPPALTPPAAPAAAPKPGAAVPTKLGTRSLPTPAAAKPAGAKPAALRPPAGIAPPPRAPLPARPPAKAAPGPLTRDPKAKPEEPAAKQPAAKPAPAKPTAAPAKPTAAPKPPTPAKALPAPQPPASATKPAGDKDVFPGASPPSGSPVPKPPAPPKVEKERKVEEFKGNKAAGELLERLATFSAFRSLGKLSEKKREEFGLEDSKKTLTLVAGGTRRTFLIGDKTYGNTDNYVLDKDEGRGYVARPRSLQDLQYAEYRLLERDLLAVDTADIEEAKITAKAGSKTVVQHSPRDPKNAAWNKAGGERKRNDLYHNWMGKLLRLRAMKYVTDETKPTGVEELCTVEFSRGGKKIGWVKLFTGTPPPKLLSAETKPKTEYYAISDNTRARVELPRSLADELVRDLDSIIKD